MPDSKAPIIKVYADGRVEIAPNTPISALVLQRMLQVAQNLLAQATVTVQGPQADNEG